MKKCLFAIIFSLFIANVYANELPATPFIECQENNCSLRLNVKNGWKIYAHSNDNPEVINFELNEKSTGINSIEIDWDQQRKKLENFEGIEVEYYVSNSNIPFKVLAEDSGKLILNINYAACKDFCGVFQDKIEYQYSHSFIPAMGLLEILLMAIVGGFILNFMPCVLPVVSMKAIHIAKKPKKDLKKVKAEILTIFSGIIFSFLGLAILTIIMKHLGHAVGWGLHFQEPIFVGMLAIVTAASAIHMFGFYEIQTPQILSRISNTKITFASDFLHGVLLVLLATPCTAPFLGTAVAFCLSSSSANIVAVYVAIGVGLGLPYLLMAIYPKALKILPKPGPWMEKFKFVAAIPFALTSLWMFFVLYSQTNIYVIFSILLLCVMILQKRYKLSGALLAMVTAAYFVNPLHGKPFISEFKVERISSEIENGRTVLVNITSDWCITCKLNEKRIFGNESVMEELNKIGTVMMIGDYTSNSRVISDYIKEKNRSGIPLSVVYGPAAPEGIVLPVIFSKQDLLNALNKAKKS